MPAAITTTKVVIVKISHSVGVIVISFESNCGRGYLRAHGARLHLSRRSHGLVQPPRSVVARVDHDGGGILRRGVREYEEVYLRAYDSVDEARASLSRTSTST